MQLSDNDTYIVKFNFSNSGFTLGDVSANSVVMYNEFIKAGRPFLIKTDFCDYMVNPGHLNYMEVEPRRSNVS